jgi:hypothetical protein
LVVVVRLVLVPAVRVLQLNSLISARMTPVPSWRPANASSSVWCREGSDGGQAAQAAEHLVGGTAVGLGAADRLARERGDGIAQAGPIEAGAVVRPDAVTRKATKPKAPSSNASPESISSVSSAAAARPPPQPRRVFPRASASWGSTGPSR